MPFRSEAQRRFLWMRHPEIAKRWSDEYPGKKELPKHVSEKEKYTNLSSRLDSKKKK